MKGAKKVAAQMQEEDFDSALDEAKAKKRTRGKKKKAAPDASLDPGRQVNVQVVVYVLAFLIIGFGLFIFIGSAVNQPPPTLSELTQEVLDGKEDEDSFLYGASPFVKIDGLWYTQVFDGPFVYDVSLHYNPKEVEDITLSGELDDRFFNDSDIYITFDPGNDENLSIIGLSAAEISLSLSTAIGRQPTAACTNNATVACELRPIITCDNTDRAVLFFEHREDTGVTLDGNCIIVHGEGRELLRATDRLIYQWYGIIR